MYVYSKQIVLLLCAAFVGSCAYSRTAVPNDQLLSQTACVEGQECTIEGKLFVYRGSPASVAELKAGNRCFAVALELNKYKYYAQKNGLTVRLRGVAYSQRTAENVVSYRLLDRDVATGICSSGLVIYAKKVEILSSTSK